MATHGPHEPILIAGGGIGGLSSAIALARAGIRVRVLERHDRPPEAGAGIQLGPNATRILRGWGILERIGDAAVQPDALHLVDGATGSALATVPLRPAAETRYGAPYLVLRRADLLNGLLRSARAEPAVELSANFAVARTHIEAQGVTALAADGRSAPGSALIGADGLFSTLRPLVAPRARLRFAGRCAWRALVPAEACPEPFAAPQVGLWMGRGAHLVHYPVSGGRAINLVAVVPDTWREEGWDGHGDPDRLLPHFARWPAHVWDMLSAAPQWRKWALFRLPPLKRWCAGRIALLGDAAHPVLPYLAQGAALAVEDAAALAAAVRARGNLGDAFAHYESARRRRVGQVQRAAWRMGAVYRLGGLAARGRNAVLRRRAPDSLLRGFDWLYGYRLPDLSETVRDRA